MGRVAPGLEALCRYDASWLRRDVVAGLSVAMVALPVGIAYSDLVRVPPVVGIYAAIFPLFAYALFGSSRQLIIGPDASTCMMTAAALGSVAAGDAEYYRVLVTIMSLIVGLIYVVMALARLGILASFLSLPILVGFQNGVALLIVASQMGRLIGVPVAPGDVLSNLEDTLAGASRIHVPTASLGIASLVGVLAMRRFVPRVPGVMVAVLAGIALSVALDLPRAGVSVVGPVPAGPPQFLGIPLPRPGDYPTLVRDAAGLALMSFTSGVLTSKSAARRSRCEVNANRELLGFGAGNIVAAFTGAFPVTGADSRTAVNAAMGGRSQLAGIVAGTVMLLTLLFLTEPLAYVPTATLAAVIVVSAASLIDVATLRELHALSRVELGLAMGTTIGVLALGVLPGVLLAVVLSLVLLLTLASRPKDAILGLAPGMTGYHDREGQPGVEPIPGLLLYRFHADLVFFNAEHFRARLLAAVAGCETPVEWVVVDASPVNVVDGTALKVVESLIDDLAARGIRFAVAHRNRAVGRLIEASWTSERTELREDHIFPTLDAAVSAFHARR